MGSIKSKKPSDVLHCEARINNVREELHTSNVPHHLRLELESKLAGCEEQFKSVLDGKKSPQDLDSELTKIEKELALDAINQAENEISRKDHTGSAFLALEDLKKELDAGTMTPSKILHEVKDIMRHH